MSKQGGCLSALANALPSFNGSKHEIIKYFVDEINALSALEKWSPEKKLLTIKLNLKDNALTFILNYPIASEIFDPGFPIDILIKNFKI